MHRKCRQSITKSERLGVRVVESDDERLTEFYAIHTDAMRRAGIATRTEATYREMWADAGAAGHGPPAVRRGRLDRCRRLRRCSWSRAVPRVADLYGGTTADGGRLRANYLLKWEAIRRSRDAGLHGVRPVGPAPSGHRAVQVRASGVPRSTTSVPGTWSPTGSATGAASGRGGAAALPPLALPRRASAGRAGRGRGVGAATGHGLRR